MNPLLISLLLMAPAADPAPLAVVERLEKWIAAEVEDKKLPALSIALVDDQRVVWSKGFGFRDRGRMVPATTETVYLRDLLKHLRGNVIVVWDRGPNHRGGAVREFLRRNRRLWLEMLPPWAPDHNPVEAGWSWLKYGELANFTPEDLEQLDDAIVERLIELKFSPGLLKALWDRSELPFPEHNIK